MNSEAKKREPVGQTDLTGQIFGELTVLERLPSQGKNKGIRWLCSCSCGQEYEVLGSLLRTGRRTHCGDAAHSKNYAKADISGRKFGRLTALEPTAQRDSKGYVIWKCRCDCGVEPLISYNELLYTNLQSCGCSRNAHREKLHTFLTHVDGTSIEMLKSKKVPSDNTTGYKGVYFIRGKYVAKIVFRKKQYFLGTYDRIEDAAEARRKAEETLFDGVAAHYQRWKKLADSDPEWAAENPIKVIVNQENGNLDVTLLPDIPEQQD